MVFRTLRKYLLLLILTGLVMDGYSKNREKIVVLTFDDAVQSHLDYVAPLLKKRGFGATFFVCNEWMKDTANFMSWEDVGQLYRMGFEIGNHSWNHAGMNKGKEVASMTENLARVDSALSANGVPRPVSFGWPGNRYCPAAIAIIRDLGYRFARRGMQPEIPYGQIAHGPVFDPGVHNRLIIPTAADAYPQWTLEHFMEVVERAEPGKAIVLQFHGVPDIAHPWVHTDPSKFALFMDYLESKKLKVIALKDLDKYFQIGEADDPALGYTY
jgi:peptidoglycan/xylan/chitin deacetylase (PgdA/CDA1 family)